MFNQPSVSRKEQKSQATFENPPRRDRSGWFLIEENNNSNE